MSLTRLAYLLIALSIVCGLAVPVVNGLSAEKARAAEPPKPVWGLPFHGLIASFQPDKGQYNIGEKITITGRMKNIGYRDAAFGISYVLYEVTPALFNEEGSSVTLTKLGNDLQSGEKKPPLAITANLVVNLKPGEEQIMAPLVLNDWYEINTPGNYHLVILRHIIGGYVVSNLMTIQIVK